MIESKNNIELRSEKVRNIVGKIPPLLLRKGIAIISLVIMLVVIGAYFMPYPELSRIKIRIYTNPPCKLIKAADGGLVYLNDSLERIDKDQNLGFIRTENDSLIELLSPFQGRILYNCRTHNKIDKNETICIIIPDSIKSAYGIGYISSKVKSKIQIGQQAEIKLNKINNGITGSVSIIYPMAKDIVNDSNYKIEISIPNSLLTSFDDSCYPYLEGEAVIHISDKSILSRFIESMGIKG